MVKVQLERLLNSADVLKRNCLADYIVRIEDDYLFCEGCSYKNASFRMCAPRLEADLEGLR